MLSIQITFKNRDRFIQLGITIATLRKLRGMSQEQLAQKANMSRSHLSSIEAPNIVRPFSLEILYNIADALDVEPCRLLEASIFPEHFFTYSHKSQTGELINSSPLGD